MGKRARRIAKGGTPITGVNDEIVISAGHNDKSGDFPAILDRGHPDGEIAYRHLLANSIPAAGLNPAQVHAAAANLAVAQPLGASVCQFAEVPAGISVRYAATSRQAAKSPGPIRRSLSITITCLYLGLRG